MEDNIKNKDKIPQKPIDRVRLIIKSEELSVSSFEKKIGLSNNSIQQALKRSTNLKDETLNNILNSFPDISAEWLLTGKGSMRKSKMNANRAHISEFISEEIIEIFDEYSKHDIIKYLHLKQKEFDEIPEFQLYKRLLIKDDVIKELLNKLKEG